MMIVVLGSVGESLSTTADASSSPFVMGPFL